MNSFFSDRISEGKAEIYGEDVAHITRVLRLSVGDRVELSDGRGNECLAVISSITRDCVYLNTEAWGKCPAEPEVFLTLFQCLPKQGKLETIVQKCVELGVSAFVPTQSERCVVRADGDYAKKLARHQKVAEEAAKQSRRGIIPKVFPPIRLDSISFDGYELVLVAYEKESERSLKAAIRGFAGKSAAIIIGPEGGFTEDEIALLTERGALSVSLGSRILRTETAGMALAAQFMYELEV